MKNNSEKSIRNKAFLLKKNNNEIEIEVEEQPIRLGDKVPGDKLIHIDAAGTVFSDISKKSNPSRTKPGSHSLSELRSFRSK